MKCCIIISDFFEFPEFLKKFCLCLMTENLDNKKTKHEDVARLHWLLVKWKIEIFFF